MTDYALLKTLHIAALIFWLGPALGAWFVLVGTKASTQYDNPTASTISRIFFHLITLEHIAFLILVSTGLGMAFKFQLFSAPWLQQKLWIVFVLVIPLELIDIWLGNWMAAKVSKKLFKRESVSSFQRNCVHWYHGKFTLLAVIILPPAVLVIMLLAVGKVPLV